MRPWINENPVYTASPVKEFRGNPLIECLNLPPLNRAEATKRLAEFPDFDPAERKLAPAFRKFLPARLTRFLFPMEEHVRVLNGIYHQVLDSYSTRNPTTSAGQKFLHNTGELRPSALVIDPHLGRLATISMVTGLPGMGKSSLIRGCMRVLGNPVIRHSQYSGAPFPETQILYLMRNVPARCTTTDFCQSYGDYTDALLGQPLYSRMFADKSMTCRDYIAQLQRIIATHHVGAIVIDCVETLMRGPKDRVREYRALMINMRDELNVSQILIGTYKAADILQGDMSSARRLVEGGLHEMRRPESASSPGFCALCKLLWDIQWVTSPIEYDERLRDLLFELSQGVTAILITLFVAAQIEAIDSGYERVDAKLLRRVYHERFKPMHEILDAIKSGDKSAMADFDDLYFNANLKLNKDPLLNRIDQIRVGLESVRERELGMAPEAQQRRPSTRTDAVKEPKKPKIDHKKVRREILRDAALPSEIA